MLANSLRASRQSLARAALRPQTASLRRTLITPTTVRQADLVQDMYLRELKAYKPTPAKASDAEGQVAKFSMPKAPASPEEADIQNDLQAYEQQVPEVEGQAPTGTTAKGVEQDWFEEPEEDDEAEAHH
ncbi:ATP synthase F0 subcomplex subunit H atp14 [Saxophila tyrrhenica]|uniref:ATP synthase F0 subcomplex subunit H atp14 n=1 Tax=Saxophila tyrrhenica TaxID=1690608 RepID=A0AAV9PD97_9PEZI|nr:ATP synthase F0 subcomplex subunit H atp14 [Saxophila tyrrhenica]